MKKTLIILLMILSLVACSKKEEVKEVASPAKQKEAPVVTEAKNDVITLTAYMQIDPSSSQHQAHNEIIAEFERQNPNIKIKPEYANGEAFHDKFKAMAAGSDIPDVFTCYVGARSDYVTKTGLALDLREYLSDEYKNEYNKNIWLTPQSDDGAIYTIPPSMAVCHAVYVNTKLQKEIGLDMPKTYEDLLAQIPAIRDEGYYAMSMGNKSPWVVNSWLLSVLIDRFGGREWFEDAAKGRNGAKFTDEPFVKSLRVIKEMTEKGLFSPGVNQMSNSEADQEFYSGKSVYLMDAGWRTSSMDRDLPADFVDSLEMIVLPAFKGEVTANSSTAVPSEGFGIANALKGSAKADAAFKFIDFYTGHFGSLLNAKYGQVPSYTLKDGEVEMKKMQKRFAEFSDAHPMGYVFDSVMNNEGVSMLNNDIQAMMLGSSITPEEIAAKYERWVAANDTNRD